MCLLPCDPVLILSLLCPWMGIYKDPNTNQSITTGWSSGFKKISWNNQTLSFEVSHSEGNCQKLFRGEWDSHQGSYSNWSHEEGCKSGDKHSEHKRAEANAWDSRGMKRNCFGSNCCILCTFLQWPHPSLLFLSRSLSHVTKKPCWNMNILICFHQFLLR